MISAILYRKYLKKKEPRETGLALVSASTNRFAFSSSIAADTWHPQKDPKAYEWWYFDALSDDHREAVVLVFLDNFIYSPRYNNKTAGSGHGNSRGQPGRFPAVSFTYFADNKQIYRAESEFSASEFKASENSPECRIGDSSFHFDSAPYGSGYIVSVNLPLSRKRTLHADLEWLSIESDFGSAPFCYDESAHCWNMVAPRSDVSGKITVEDARGRILDSRTFRGTGYHDHNLDNRWLAKTVREWHWGRAHFTDSTLVFCRYIEDGEDEPSTQLILVKDGELQKREVLCEQQDYIRDKYGIRYPTRLSLLSEDNIRVETRPLKVIDSSFYHLRFLSSMTMSGLGGREHSTYGITEFIAPRALKYRWLNWISDLRIGRNGRGPRI